MIARLTIGFGLGDMTEWPTFADVTNKTTCIMKYKFSELTDEQKEVLVNSWIPPYQMDKELRLRWIEACFLNVEEELPKGPHCQVTPIALTTYLQCEHLLDTLFKKDDDDDDDDADDSPSDDNTDWKWIDPADELPF